LRKALGKQAASPFLYKKWHLSLTNGQANDRFISINDRLFSCIAVTPSTLPGYPASKSLITIILGIFSIEAKKTMTDGYLFENVTSQTFPCGVCITFSVFPSNINN
jgi:hypothetical protein